MAARKENVPLIIAIIVIFSAIVGVRAYRDMHPPPADLAAALAQSYAYYVQDDKTIKQVPDDQRSVFIKIGDFVVDTKDDVTYLPNGPQPTLFAQRDTVIVFNINKLPKNSDAVFSKIESAVDPWKKVGNIFNAIIIDDQEEKPDVEALGVFCNDLKVYLRREHSIGLQLKRHNLPNTPAERNKLANILKSAQYFIFNFEDVRSGQETFTETLARLDKDELPFMLRFKKLPDDFSAKGLKQLKELKPEHYLGTLIEQVPQNASSGGEQ